MELTLSREQLLNPLNQIIGAVERKMTFPILANVKVETKDNKLILTGTDLEVELQSSTQLDQAPSEACAITLPGKKLADICKMLPDESSITLKLNGNQIEIRAQKSRFKLATMPVTEFPSVAIEKDQGHQFEMRDSDLYSLLQRTQFAMAQQDVRYFLNGMLFDFDGEQTLNAVATDRHRLATNQVLISTEHQTAWQAIIPRKTVAELIRLVTPEEKQIHVQLTEHHICFSGAHFTLTSKLIDGKFPDYRQVLPKNWDKSIHIDRDLFKNCLVRASILSSEKHRSVVLSLNKDEMQIIANNPDQEEATESIPVTWDHATLEIAFNVTYLLNILAAVAPGEIEIHFKSTDSSVLITESDDKINALYVIMPMRI